MQNLANSQEIILNDSLTKFAENCIFISNFETNIERMLVFGFNGVETFLKTYPFFYLDGIYKISLKYFTLLYIISIDIGSDVSETNIYSILYVPLKIKSMKHILCDSIF